MKKDTRRLKNEKEFNTFYFRFNNVLQLLYDL